MTVVVVVTVAPPPAPESVKAGPPNPGSRFLTGLLLTVGEGVTIQRQALDSLDASHLEGT